MKDVKVLSSGKQEFGKSDIRMAVIYHLTAAVIGFVLCRAIFFDKFMPLGVAYTAGIAPVYMPSAMIGVIVGYLFSGIAVSGFRYIAAALAVIAVRFIISFSKRLNTNPLFAALISGIALSVTSAVAFQGINVDIVHITLEIPVVCTAAIVISRTFSFLPTVYKGLSHEELGCLFIVISMVIAGLYPISIFSVSLSGILYTALILTSGKYAGFQASVACSVSVSLMLFFIGRPARICLVYAVAALVSGLVISFGKYIQLCTFFTCVVVFALVLEANAATAAFITEILLGCITFALIPKTVGIRLGKVFTCFPQISVNNDLNRAVTIRLNEAAAGIKEVKATVDEVASRLEDINAPGFSAVLARIKDSACGGCKMHSKCWELKKEETLDCVFKMIKGIRANTPAYIDTMPDELKNRCLRPKEFCKSLADSYLSYSNYAQAKDRIQQIRQAVGESFEGIGVMLDELAQDFSVGVRFDNSAALTAVCALKNLGIVAEECSAPVDKYGRMKINLRLMKPNDTVLNKRDIMKALSLSCERNFAPPVIKKSSGETFISISERAQLRVDIGVCQKSAKPGDMCGDSYSYFSDGTGHFIIILSDGMGTGSRAAVDSAMASGLIGKLIKSGLGYGCALKILNSSMLFKSTDESLSTLDIASIDLHTGQIELYKAGAAPTFVRRSGRAGKAVSTSMPIGILSDVSFDEARIKLAAGDIIVLLSDGATANGTKWIKDELERYDGSAQELSDRLCTLAQNRYSDSRADDITVITAIIS